MTRDIERKMNAKLRRYQRERRSAAWLASWKAAWYRAGRQLAASRGSK